jgi:hypothetical protein
LQIIEPALEHGRIRHDWRSRPATLGLGDFLRPYYR